MTSHHDESPLPRINDEDLGAALVEDIIDPTHKARFEHLSQTNPRLIREIVRRAYLDAYAVTEQSEQATLRVLDLQKLIIDHVTFALDALEKSMERHDQPGKTPPGADQPHSADNS